jgi:hypothetical protein
LPLAEPISHSEFTRLWFWLYETLDRKIDPTGKNPDRMFFLPRATKEALEQKWPWMQAVHGPVLHYNMVPADFKIPDEFRHDVMKPTRKQGMHLADKPTSYRPTDAHKHLEFFMELPLYRWAVEHAEEVSREVWRGIAINMAAIVLEADDAEVESARMAFHELSEADPARYDYGATERVWRDAFNSAVKPGPMSYAHMVLNGAPTTLQSDGEARSPIAHARRQLIDAEREWEKQARRPKPLAPEQKKASPGATKAESTLPTPEQEKVVEDSLPADPDAAKTIMDYSQKDFLYDASNHVYVLKEVDPQTGEKVWALDSALRSEPFNNLLMSWGLPKKDLDVWKSHIPVFVKSRAIYSRPHEHLVAIGDYMYFNSYQPTTLAPRPGDWNDIRALFLHLVGGDPDALEYALDWFAYPLQKLRLRQDHRNGAYKTGSALVFRGDPGAGKGTAMTIMQLCYGYSNCTTLSQDGLDSRFHDQLAGKLFVVGNEVISGSNRSTQTANMLKTWITDPFIRLEQKGRAAFEMENNFNLVLTTNDERPVLIEPKDRRYSVFASTAIPKAVVAPVIQDIATHKQQVAAFYDHLLSRDIKMAYGELYGTAAKVAVQNATKPSAQRFAESILVDGFLTVANGWVAAARPGEAREATLPHGDAFMVPSETLMSVYRHYCHVYALPVQNVRQVTQVLLEAFEHLGVRNDARAKNGVSPRPRGWVGLPMLPPDEDAGQAPAPAIDQPSAPESATTEGDNPELV